jgi:hypothetical protein
MKKVSLFSLIFIATTACAMDGEDKERAEELSMAYNNTQQMLGMLLDQAPLMTSPSAALCMAAFISQNKTMQAICQNNLQLLLMAMAAKQTAAHAQPHHETPAEIAAHVRDLAIKAEHEEAVKHIAAQLEKLEQDLTKKLGTTKEIGYGSNICEVALSKQELVPRVDCYVGQMNTAESSLIHILEDQHITETQKAKAYELINKARHQSAAAKAQL